MLQLFEKHAFFLRHPVQTRWDILSIVKRITIHLVLELIWFSFVSYNDTLCSGGSCRSGLYRKARCYSKSVTYSNLWPKHSLGAIADTAIK